MQFVFGVLFILLLVLGLAKMIKLFLCFGALILLGLLLYFRSSYKEAADLLDSGEHEFSLSRRELAALSESDSKVSKQKDELSDLQGVKQFIESKIENLFDIGAEHGLRLRNDNFFDARSSKGKELNNHIEEQLSELSQAKNHIRDSKSTLEELESANEAIKNLPGQRKFYKTAGKVTFALSFAYAVFVLYFFATH